MNVQVHTRHKKDTKIKQERAGGDFVCMSVIFLYSSVDSSFQRASNTCHTDELHSHNHNKRIQVQKGERVIEKTNEKKTATKLPQHRS